jgi:hypothetical protein
VGDQKAKRELKTISVRARFSGVRAFGEWSVLLEYTVTCKRKDISHAWQAREGYRPLHAYCLHLSKQDSRGILTLKHCYNISRMCRTSLHKLFFIYLNAYSSVNCAELALTRRVNALELDSWR